MNKIFFHLVIMFVAIIGNAQNIPTIPSSKYSLDKGWRFHLGDIPFPEIKGHGNSYANAKAGKAWGAAAPEYNDKNWQTVTLPHDWSVELPVDSNENVSQGFRTRGFGWYRRSFTVDPKDKGQHFELQFDGVATHCTVWFNGTVVHRNFCGYNSFYIDITPFVKYGDNNVNHIAVRVDAVQQEGWWYEGAGIYRHTYLVKRPLTHIMTDGVFAHPVKQSNNNWLIPVEATITNAGYSPVSVTIESQLYDASGKFIAKSGTSSTVNHLKNQTVKYEMQVNNPVLWSLENPTLYTVKTILKDKGIPVDSVTTTCGFRTIKFTVDSGFYLNDKHVKIKGVCNHQDHAGVGVAVPDALWEFRLRKMKEMGTNAYRCAHNPPSKEFLDACDKIGILVMDENRNFNVTPEYVRQLEWLVQRDRNHPSIFLWSVFNEEPMQGTENGYEMVRRMAAVIKNYDTTRPVTAAASGGLNTPKNVAHAVDVIGMNYMVGSYDEVHKLFPHTPVTSSEDGSAYMVRGEYVTDRKKWLHGSYDTESADWGTTNRRGWKLVNERPYLAGCFIWTGFDYKGEPQPYEWPATGSSFGLMDQCGFPKAAYYFRQAQWLDKPILKLIPHWNWPADSIGKQMKVMAITNADSVRLFLNGKLVAASGIDPYKMGEWMVPYKPGKLEAKSYVKGKLIQTEVVETTSDPVALQLIPDRNFINNDGQDAIPITVQAVDAKGRIVPTANFNVQFYIEGPAKNIGVGNGNPNSHEMDKADHRNLFNGFAQLIIQSLENQKGAVTIKARAAGMQEATVTIMVKEAAQLQYIK
jgi:beta-galactosidase